MSPHRRSGPGRNMGDNTVQALFLYPGSSAAFPFVTLIATSMYMITPVGERLLYSARCGRSSHQLMLAIWQLGYLIELLPTEIRPLSKHQGQSSCCCHQH